MKTCLLSLLGLFSLVFTPEIFGRTSGNSIIPDDKSSSIPSTEISGEAMLAPSPAYTDPVSVTICAGGTASFTIGSSVVGTTYQWQGSANGGSTWTNLANVLYFSGATTTTLTIIKIPVTLDGTLYRCMITKALMKPSYSAAATLAVRGVINSGSNVEICAGGSTSFTITVSQSASVYSYLWLYSTDGTNFTSITAAGTSPVYSNWTTTSLGISNAPSGIRYYHCRVLYDKLGTCSDYSSSRTMTVSSSAPSTTTTITGNNEVCRSQSNVLYSLQSDIPRATSYVWTLPSGASGSSTNNSISVSFASNANNGNITVKGQNACGIGPPTNYAVTVRGLPAAAGTITGSATLCQGSTASYSVAAITDAVSYTWTLPAGFTPAGGTTSNTISINFSASAASGTIKVKGNNNCGAGTESSLYITVNPKPADAGTISGSDVVCQGQNNVNYSVPAIANAERYDWVLPNGSTGSSTTNSILVNFGVNASTGSVSVSGYNAQCLSGAGSSKQVTVNPLPVNNGSITGKADVCAGETGVVYTATGVSLADSYVWTLPDSVTGSSSTNSITVNYGAGASQSGNIKVKGHNGCGDSQESVLNVKIDQLPSAPSVISGLATVCQGQKGVIYSIDALNNVNSYVWTKPSGETAETTSASLAINYPADVTAGNIKVKGQNACGYGEERTLAVSVNPLPGEISSITGKTNVCQGEQQLVYKIADAANANTYKWTLLNGNTSEVSADSIMVDIGIDMVSGYIKVKGHNNCGDGVEKSLWIDVTPLPEASSFIAGEANICRGALNVSYSTSPITSADSYEWTLPTGVTGSSTTNNISLSFGPESSTGNLTVKGINSCGAGDESSLLINVRNIPANAGEILGDTSVCQGETNQVYSISPIEDATTYFWTTPFGANGTSTSELITLGFTADAISGTISVKGRNICGDGGSSSLPVNVHALPQVPRSMSGPVSVEKGQTGVAYSIPLIPGALTYQWTLPEGVTGSSSTNNISVDFSQDAANGTISVKGVNDCGAGPSASLDYTVKGPSAIMGNNREASKWISIIPNPSSDYIEIVLRNEKTGTARIGIYNSIGMLVKTFQIPKSGRDLSYKINISELREGVYFLETSIDLQTSQYVKFIISR